MAKDIAAILGASKRCDGYYEGSGYKVTWTFGHLCTLKEPADYTELWKRWSLGALPMIPSRFGIKVIADKGIEKQFNIIKCLISEAEEVINCGDAGQEGELIQRWVMQKADIHCPVKRLWISSLTDESIKEGFKSLKPQADYDLLYYAGLSPRYRRLDSGHECHTIVFFKVFRSRKCPFHRTSPDPYACLDRSTPS